MTPQRSAPAQSGPSEPGRLDPVRAALRDTRPADKPQAHQKYWQELLGQTGGPVRRPSRHMG